MTTPVSSINDTTVSLTDETRVSIYGRNMFIVPTGCILMNTRFLLNSFNHFKTIGWVKIRNFKPNPLGEKPGKSGAL
jgi:hypothetical protein